MNKYKINKGLITQKLDKETVIFDADKSVLFTFNKTASYIFSKIKAGWDEEKISKMLIKNYEIKESRALKDVKELVQKLLKKGIIK